MPARHSDKELNELIYRVIVPKGLRPTTPEDIDAMLDAIGGSAPSEESVQRMLRKIRGEVPIGTGSVAEGLGDRLAVADDANISEEALALYRNRNDDIPPEIKEKLKDMEERAMEEGEEADQGDTDA